MLLYAKLAKGGKTWDLKDQLHQNQRIVQTAKAVVRFKTIKHVQRVMVAARRTERVAAKKIGGEKNGKSF
jgi:hypothetical protein